MYDRFVRSGVHTQVKFMINNYGVRHFSFTLVGTIVALTTEVAKAKHLSFRLETVPAAKQSVSSTRALADRFDTSKTTVTERLPRTQMLWGFLVSRMICRLPFSSKRSTP